METKSINTTNMKKIFSFDAETNGLWGCAFAISAVVKDGDDVKTFIGRCPITEDVNPWVKENVLPQMENIPVDCKDYSDLLKKFSEFYLENKSDSDIIVHMGVPVEAKVLLDMHSHGFIGDWDGPYPLIDISAYPEIGDSCDTYNKVNGIEIPDLDGGTHNPLYDSWSALLAYQHYKG